MIQRRTPALRLVSITNDFEESPLLVTKTASRAGNPNARAQLLLLESNIDADGCIVWFRPPQPHRRPRAVLVDEDHGGGLDGGRYRDR